jgi:hypothetical protein
MAVDTAKSFYENKEGFVWRIRPHFDDGVGCCDWAWEKIIYELSIKISAFFYYLFGFKRNCA